MIKVIITERLREFEIRFTNITATPRSVVLVGYPTLDCNTVRENVRETLRMLGYPLFEPYKNNTYHMTLVRFAQPLTPQQVDAVNRMVHDDVPLQNQTFALLRVQNLSMSPASWKMQEEELQGEEIVKLILDA